MKIIIIGAPGAGKGTQAEIISNTLNIPTISTGAIIRDALKSGSEMGIKAKEYMEGGKLVPDDVVIGIIRERLSQPDCQNGFILDGFPRTIPQAEALENMGIDIDRVIDIEVDDQVIAQRVSGRRVCPACGATYHTEYRLPVVEGICDKCGDTLIQRKDDKPETVRERLHVYHAQTEPLKGFYTSRKKLFVVQGQKNLEDTTRLVLSVLEDKA